MKINCVAVDDEPLAIDIIEDYIRKIPYLHHMQSFTGPLDALEFMRNKEVDLVFLDIQMEDLTGIQLIKVLPYKPFIILTTAFDNYALKGYELDIVDYLLKPISFDRFVLACNKVFERKQSNSSTSDDTGNLTISNPKYDYFFVKADSKFLKVNFNDILYIEGQGDYLRIITSSDKIMTLQNFKKMEEILPVDNFIRVHKSYMVAVDKIKVIERNRILIQDKTIPVSVTYKGSLSKVLKERGMG